MAHTSTTAPVPHTHPIVTEPNTTSTPVSAPTMTIYARAAGATLLLMAALAGFGNFIVVQRFITAGDPTATATAILDAEGTFGLGVMALYLAAALDVLIAALLYRLFAPVNPAAARLEAWLRLTYAAVFAVAISQLAAIPDLLHDPVRADVFTPAQVHVEAFAAMEAFHHTWFAGLLLFGAHLMVLGYVAYRSGYLPRALGVLVLIAGAGYAIDTVTDVLSAGTPFTVSTVTFVGEFLLGVWLLVRARHIGDKAARHAV
jgi:Domain of unknown function (DUF4386)